MKKSQRSRLAFLSGKTAATLTTAEAADLTTLQVLASQHPNASADEDDSKPTSVEGFMAKFTAAFSAKERLATENASLQQRIVALEAGNIGAATLAAVATALGLKAADLTGKTAAEIATAIKSATGAVVVGVEAQLTDLKSQLALATTAFATLAGQLGLSITELSGKDAAGVTAAFERVISNRTLAQVKELGFNASELPSQQQTKTGTSLEEHMTAYAALTNPKEAAKYYATNIESLLSGKN